MGIPHETMKLLQGVALCWFASCILLISAEESKPAETSERNGKVLPVFQVVKFPNDNCIGATMNGTCYTSEECSSKSGKNDGSCASGFGVCCVFSLACGGTASENQTYLTQTSATAVASPCTYTICPCSSNICRIRYDFTTFVLANAVQGTTSVGAIPAAGSLTSGALGDCTTDTFSINGAIGVASPIICGTNSGYHMIIDSDGETCQSANFDIGGSLTTSRSWSIRVTQYACGDYDNSGWPGCLQYFREPTGNFASYGFPAGVVTATATGTGTAIDHTVTHLQNQRYQICIRRASGNCYICYSPTVALPATNAISEATQNSFGLSISSATIAVSVTNTLCTSDYIEIPGGNTQANAAALNINALAAITHVTKFCGRFLNLQTGIALSATVCTASTPFRVGVNFDNIEQQKNTVANTMANVNEQIESPGGITGFKLNYWQRTCT